MGQKMCYPLSEQKLALFDCISEIRQKTFVLPFFLKLTKFSNLQAVSFSGEILNGEPTTGFSQSSVLSDTCLGRSDVDEMAAPA